MMLSEGDRVILSVRQRVTVRFADDIDYSCSRTHISPINTGLQRVLDHSIRCYPDGELGEDRDSFNNIEQTFEVKGHHRLIDIVASSRVQTTNAISCGAESAPDPRHYRERWSNYLQWSQGVPELTQYNDIPLPSGICMEMDDIEFGHALYETACNIHKALRFNPYSVGVLSDVAALFQQGSGSSQDLSHAMIGLLRHAGIPARFASGYIFNPVADEMGDPLRRVEGSFGWVQAWHEGYGWMGIDPTNAKLVDWQYVRTAIGRDYFDVPSIACSSNADVAQQTETVAIVMLDADQSAA